jgi:16S rRNA (uracil1498-N3)-methyltransferase
MNRFFTTHRIDEEFHIVDKEDIKHIAKVLRMKPGDPIEICDNEHEYLCEITSIEETIVCRIIEKNDIDRESPLEIILFQGLPKKDKMEWIVQKTVELGVSAIIPVNTRRTIKKVKKEDTIDRWNKIALSAAMQSKRIRIPKVSSPLEISEVIDVYGDGIDVLIVPYESEEHLGIREVLDAFDNLKRVGIFIGPEGGLAPEDLEDLSSEKTQIVTLGKRILRAETAAIITTGIIQFYRGDM